MNEWWMMRKKRFSDFAETLHIESTWEVIFLIFGVWRENFLMGIKIDFKYEILGFWKKEKEKENANEEEKIK